MVKARAAGAANTIRPDTAAAMAKRREEGCFMETSAESEFGKASRNNMAGRRQIGNPGPIVPWATTIFGGGAKHLTAGALPRVERRTNQLETRRAHSLAAATPRRTDKMHRQYLVQRLPAGERACFRHRGAGARARLRPRAIAFRSFRKWRRPCAGAADGVTRVMAGKNKSSRTQANPGPAATSRQTLRIYFTPRSVDADAARLPQPHDFVLDQ